MFPLLHQGLVIVIKPSQKSQLPNPLNLNPVFQEDNILRRSTRERKPNKKYLDISLIFTGFNFWNSKSSNQSDIHTTMNIKFKLKTVK